MHCNTFFSKNQSRSIFFALAFLVHLSRPSVHLLSLTFHISNFSSKTAQQNSILDKKQDRDIFAFSSETAKRNSTKLNRKQDFNVFYQVCVFRANRKNKDGRPGLWFAETFSTSLKPLNGIQRSLTEATSQRPLPSLCFSGRSEKQDGRPDLWLAETYFRLLLWNSWTELNETWQEAKSQRPLPSLCFSSQSEKRDGPLTSDWLRHFRLLLWNRWTEFNKTWQEARS